MWVKRAKIDIKMKINTIQHHTDQNINNVNVKSQVCRKVSRDQCKRIAKSSHVSHSQIYNMCQMSKRFLSLSETLSGWVE